MTEKRFYLMNVEDPLHEYGRWCKPVLEDGETGKQYEGALEVMDLLNECNDENEQLKQSVSNLKDTIIKITIAYQRKYDRTIVDLVDEVHDEDITDLIKELQE